MRSVITMRSNISRAGLEGALQVLLNADWKFPLNKDQVITSLISRIYPDYREEIKIMNNIAFVHKNISNCEVLFSYSDTDMQIRVFHDHLETLRELTGALLKEVATGLIKSAKANIEILAPIIISEAHNNNILHTGVMAIKQQDYMAKVIQDRNSEVSFFGIAFILSILMLIYISYAFGTHQNNTVFYEIVGKIAGPFLATSFLTGTNLLLYYWKLKEKTNIIWE